MTLEQQVASLNDNVGNLVLKSNELTKSIEDKLKEYEDWKNSISSDNPVILQIGPDKEFKHPVDAAKHIEENDRLTGDILWKLKIDIGIYEFPYQGIHSLTFSHNKNVQIIGNSENISDVVFRYIGNERLYMIIAERNSHIEVRNISFTGITQFTSTFVIQIHDKSLREGMAGGGLAHGILARYNSSAIIEDCNFYRLWRAIHCHDNCKMDIANITGSELHGGVYCNSNSKIYISRSSIQGAGVSNNPSTSSWSALAAHHASTIFCYGVDCRNFHMGLYAHWSSDFHFHRAHDYDADGITQINIKDGHVENCYHAFHIHHASGGNINNTLIKGIHSHAIISGQSSNVHAGHNVRVDGADIGYYAIHQSVIGANSSSAKNCRGIGYSSRHKSEIHAHSTSTRLGGNKTNYSPGTSHALGNYDAYIYRS